MAAPELCPCLDALFPGESLEGALQRLAALGFRQFEFWDWRARDLDALAAAAARSGVSPAAFSGNTFEEPLLDREAHGRALAHLRQSLQAAQRLGVRLLVVHVGYTLPATSHREQWEAAVRGLLAAGDLAAAAGVMLALEPLNSRIDHPGYFLDSLPQALRMLAEVDHPAVRLLLDIYHMWVMHGDLRQHLPQALPLVAHVHVADVPGRGEPGSGTIPWGEVMDALRRGGYEGAVGLECWPTGSVEAALRRSVQALTFGAVREKL
ncbi:MAG: TIM barrel protein [Armatimonadota bacterium]|nr:TIM barrel protein [Armatimonadota bacterium]MDR7470152.1 TIM barrel protein [Armatimonadota bacterium]MDR7473981.1 TIM barrel protein [Armatimonadota bacterium]MDR7537976.1 TIM barrel protein [Armatimonadota bacterium]